MRVDLAISSWSLHTEFLNPRTSELRVDQFPRIASEVFGVGFVEFYEGDYASDFMHDKRINESYAKCIRNACDDAEVRVACIASINDLTTPNGTENVDLDRLLKWADHCEILGCRILRINTGRTRITPIDVSRLIDRVGELLRRTESYDLTLALENHPHDLRHDHDTDLLLSAVEHLNSDRVGTCPDVGAMVPGYWKRGFERLAKRAVHVHLKPTVLMENGTEIGISEYGKEIRTILSRAEFDGVASVEYTNLEDFNADSYEQTSRTLRDAAVVFGASLKPPQASPPQKALPPKFKVNDREDISPARRILQLLADGCEHELQAQVKIHDFARVPEAIYSSSAAHRTGTASSCDSCSFCSLVDNEPNARKQCDKFYQDKLDNIRFGRQQSSKICICPMGLMVLSIPIQDERNKLLYGAISAGPWIEQGTEGAVEHAIVHYVPEEKQNDFQSAALDVTSYTLARLRKSEELLEELARELAQLYGRVYVDYVQTQASTDIVQELKLLGQLETVDDFISKLPHALNKLQQQLDIGPAALYQRQDDPITGTRSFVLLARTADDVPLPQSLPLLASKEVRWQSQLKTELANLLPDHDVLSPIDEDSDEFVVFCVLKNRNLTERTHTSLAGFALDVERILGNLRSLDAVERRRDALEIFIDRTKHALASPLQGVSDRVLQIGDLLQDNKLRPDTVTPLVSDLRNFTRDAGNVVHRFMSRARVTSAGTDCDFKPCNLAEIVTESVSKLRHHAKQRSIKIDITQLGVLPDIEGDRADLVEVFDNLLENAVKFAHDDTEIYVTGEMSNTIDGWTLASSGQRIVITDRGIGIPEDARDGIFEPYKRGNVPAQLRVVRGTGLGLYICRNIVAEHSGHITYHCKHLHVRSGTAALNDCKVAFQVDLPSKPVKD